MSKRKRNKKHMDRVARIPCIACTIDGAENEMVELHHPRFLAGMGMRAPDEAVIPLCHAHHRTGGKGVALHAAQWTFEAVYGSEESLLRKVYDELGEDYPF